MNEIQISLETVTPLLLHGTSPEGPPELRPPAFRGALRYWLRAAAGGVIGDNNLEGLHQIERVVLGSAEHGSPISLQIKGDLSDHIISAPILPHKGGSTRQAFDANQKFSLLIRQRQSAYDDRDRHIMNFACMCINLFVLFGGVGLRSRRGYGSFRTIHTSSDLIFSTPTTIDEFKKHIQKITRLSRKTAASLAQDLDINIVDLPNGTTKFPSASQTSLVWLPNLPKSQSPVEAISLLMSTMPKDPAFGEINPRNASPLWARIIFIDGQYRVLFCLLTSTMSEAAAANYPKIHEFLENNFPGESLVLEGWNQ